MARRKAHKPAMGSVSSGTLLTEDLLVAFADELEWIAPRGHAKLIREARKVADCIVEEKPVPQSIEGHELSRDELGSDLVNELEDALNRHAPYCMTFGAHDGDGADFGWWPCMDIIEELPCFDGASEAREEKHFGEFRTVTDHGNVDVWNRRGNGRIVHVIGIV